MYAHGVNEMQDKMLKHDVHMALFGGDVPLAKERWNEKVSVEYKSFCDRYEKFLRDNAPSGHQPKWLLGERLTWADLFLAELNDRIMNCLQADALDKHPLLKQHHNRVHELPAIKKRVSERKKMSF
jgi:glutathione S-transferase